MRIGETVIYTIDLRFSTGSACSATIKSDHGIQVASGLGTDVPEAIYKAACQLAGKDHS